MCDFAGLTQVSFPIILNETVQHTGKDIFSTIFKTKHIGCISLLIFKKSKFYIYKSEVEKDNWRYYKNLSIVYSYSLIFPFESIIKDKDLFNYFTRKKSDIFRIIPFYAIYSGYTVKGIIVEIFIDKTRISIIGKNQIVDIYMDTEISTSEHKYKYVKCYKINNYTVKKINCVKIVNDSLNIIKDKETGIRLELDVNESDIKGWLLQFKDIYDFNRYIVNKNLGIS